MTRIHADYRDYFRSDRSGGSRAADLRVRHEPEEEDEEEEDEDDDQEDDEEDEDSDGGYSE